MFEDIFLNKIIKNKLLITLFVLILCLILIFIYNRYFQKNIENFNNANTNVIASLKDSVNNPIDNTFFNGIGQEKVSISTDSALMNTLNSAIKKLDITNIKIDSSDSKRWMELNSLTNEQCNTSSIPTTGVVPVGVDTGSGCNGDQLQIEELANTPISHSEGRTTIVVEDVASFPNDGEAIGYFITGKSVLPNTTIVENHRGPINNDHNTRALYITLSSKLTNHRDKTFCYTEGVKPCKYGEDTYGPCEGTCGTTNGIQNIIKNVISEAKNGGTPCNTAIKTRPCTMIGPCVPIISISELTTTSFTVGVHNQESMPTYTVTITNNNERIIQEKNINNPSNQTTFTGLTPGATYNVRVKARNAYGEQTGTSSTTTLNPQNCVYGTPIMGQCIGQCGTTNGTRTVTPQVITEAKNGGLACNRATTSEQCNMLPPCVPVIAVSALTTDSFTVTVQNQPSIPDNTYVMTINANDGSNFQLQKKGNGRIFDNLRPGTTYNVRVTAKNDYGEQTGTATATTLTPRDCVYGEPIIGPCIGQCGTTNGLRTVTPQVITEASNGGRQCNRASTTTTCSEIGPCNPGISIQDVTTNAFTVKIQNQPSMPTYTVTINSGSFSKQQIINDGTDQTRFTGLTAGATYSISVVARKNNLETSASATATTLNPQDCVYGTPIALNDCGPCGSNSGTRLEIPVIILEASNGGTPCDRETKVVSCTNIGPCNPGITIQFVTATSFIVKVHNQESMPTYTVTINSGSFSKQQIINDGTDQTRFTDLTPGTTYSISVVARKNNLEASGSATATTLNPQDCVYGTPIMGQCIGQCGTTTGTRTVTPQVITEASNGGLACNTTPTTNQCTEIAPCNPSVSIRDLTTTSFTVGVQNQPSMPTYTVTINSGTFSKQQIINNPTNQTNFAGLTPGATYNVRVTAKNDYGEQTGTATATTLNPQNCVYGTSIIGACEGQCGTTNGTRTVTPQVIREASNGGLACDTTPISQSCNNLPPCAPVFSFVIGGNSVTVKIQNQQLKPRFKAEISWYNDTAHPTYGYTIGLTKETKEINNTTSSDFITITFNNLTEDTNFGVNVTAINTHGTAEKYDHGRTGRCAQKFSNPNDIKVFPTAQTAEIKNGWNHAGIYYLIGEDQNMDVMDQMRSIVTHKLNNSYILYNSCHWKNKAGFKNENFVTIYLTCANYKGIDICAEQNLWLDRANFNRDRKYPTNTNNPGSRGGRWITYFLQHLNPTVTSSVTFKRAGAITRETGQGDSKIATISGEFAGNNSNQAGLVDMIADYQGVPKFLEPYRLFYKFEQY